MYTEPFKVLKEKVPFLEFAWRMGKLIINPKIDSKDTFSSSDSRYALWDIFLALSLIAVVMTLGYVFTGDDYFQRAQKVLNQSNMLFSLGYYAVLTLFSFFLIVLCLFRFLQKRKDSLTDAFLATLFFARCHALKIILIAPFIIWNIDLLSSELMNYDEYIEQNLAKSLGIGAIALILLVWCIYEPLRKFVFPTKEIWLSYMLITMMLYASTELNQRVPALVTLNFHNFFSCDKAYKSQKFSALSEAQKMKFKQNCENSDWK